MASKVIRIAVVCVISLIFLNLAYPLKAQEAPAKEKEIKKTVTVKTIQGEVSGISSNFIAVVYGQDKKTSYEMAFNIGKDAKIEYKKSLKEISVGDIVAVEYEETVEIKKGEKPRTTQRVVKMIKFLKSPQIKPETNALVSAETPAEDTKESPVQ